MRQGAYEDAIAHLDAGIHVTQKATPDLVRIAESRFSGVAFDEASEREYARIAREYLEPLKEQDIDTLVLGCTHYPLICDLVSDVMGPGVALVSSAEETAREVRSILKRRGDLAQESAGARVQVMVTGDDVEKFRLTAQGVLGMDVPVERVDLGSRGGEEMR